MKLSDNVKFGIPFSFDLNSNYAVFKNGVSVMTAFYKNRKNNIKQTNELEIQK